MTSDQIKGVYPLLKNSKENKDILVVKLHSKENQMHYSRIGEFNEVISDVIILKKHNNRIAEALYGNDIPGQYLLIDISLIEEILIMSQEDLNNELKKQRQS